MTDIPTPALSELNAERLRTSALYDSALGWREAYRAWAANRALSRGMQRLSRKLAKARKELAACRTPSPALREAAKAGAMMLRRESEYSCHDTETYTKFIEQAALLESLAEGV